jgi:hypothetical protein
MEIVITAFAAISNALNHVAPKARYQRERHVNKGEALGQRSVAGEQAEQTERVGGYRHKEAA